MEMKDVMEIIFNIFYLIVIWYLAIKMYKNIDSLNSKDRKTGKLLALAFLLLALGDTGHVGFRVLAYLKGGLTQNAYLLGMGKMFTSITVTIFYMLLVEVWRARFDKKHNIVTIVLLLCGIARLIILFLPGNQWGSQIAPMNFEMYRNIPLMILGLGVAILIFKDSKDSRDNTFRWFSIMIFISYAFYIPVILFARYNSTIGLLMIPKTVAYLAAAFIGYNGIFK